MIKMSKKLFVLLVAGALLWTGCESKSDDQGAAAPAEETAAEEAQGAEETAEEEGTEEQEAADEENPLAAPDDVAAPPADAEKTESGLASKVLKAGDGEAHPTATSVVTVHYTGWTTDGERFDSSVARGEPTSFPLNQVIAGWTEGLQLMVVGEKRRLWIPEELAYKGMAGRPAGMLVFDVELLEIAD